MRTLAALPIAAALALAGCSSENITVTTTNTADKERALEFVIAGCSDLIDAASEGTWLEETVITTIRIQFIEAALLDDKWTPLVDDAVLAQWAGNPVGSESLDAALRGEPFDSFLAAERLYAYCDVLAAKGDTGSE